mmetsp:Transcript_67213/g.156012  ORF Transcript_67213/g.156012 Transcript_67213/m.156012 type:complete len:200 (-) Transcript_67213:1917-2516(-)
MATGSLTWNNWSCSSSGSTFHGLPNLGQQRAHAGMPEGRRHARAVRWWLRSRPSNNGEQPTGCGHHGRVPSSYHVWHHDGSIATVRILRPLRVNDLCTLANVNGAGYRECASSGQPLQLAGVINGEKSVLHTQPPHRRLLNNVSAGSLFARRLQDGCNLVHDWFDLFFIGAHHVAVKLKGLVLPPSKFFVHQPSRRATL